MSQIQQHTKPVLIPLVTGAPTVLDPYAQRRIAAWAAMTIMVAEFHEPDKVAISTNDREYLWGHRDAPPLWKIWIGHYVRGEWAGHWMHNVLPIYAKENVPDIPVGSVPLPNTQTTTFVAGELYIHAISSSDPEVTGRVHLTGDAADKTALIWPARTDPITWPLQTLTDIEAHEIAYIFFNRALTSTGHDPI